MKKSQLKEVKTHFECGAMRVVLFASRNRAVIINDDGTTVWRGFGRRRPTNGLRGLPVEEIRPVYIGDGYDLY